MNEYLKVIRGEFCKVFKQTLRYWQVLVVAVIFGVFFKIMDQWGNVDVRVAISIVMTLVFVLGLIFVIDYRQKLSVWWRLFWADVLLLWPVLTTVTLGRGLNIHWIWLPVTVIAVPISVVLCIKHKNTVWKALKSLLCWEVGVTLVYSAGCFFVLMQNPECDSNNLGACILLTFMLTCVFVAFAVLGGKYADGVWNKATFINIGVIFTISCVIDIALTEKSSLWFLLPPLVVQILIFICMYVQHVRKEVQKRRDAAVNQE